MFEVGSKRQKQMKCATRMQYTFPYFKQSTSCACSSKVLRAFLGLFFSPFMINHLVFFPFCVIISQEIRSENNNLQVICWSRYLKLLSSSSYSHTTLENMRSSGHFLWKVYLNVRKPAFWDYAFRTLAFMQSSLWLQYERSMIARGKLHRLNFLAAETLRC